MSLKISSSSETAPGTRAEKSREEIDCGIIIITYNSTRHIEELLNSLPAATVGLRTRCVIVDNNSKDDTLSILRSRDDVEMHNAGGNLGYSGGINLGRSVIGPCSSLLILNPDLILEPGAVTHLYRAVNETDVGVTVPMLCTSDGALFFSLRRELSLLNAFGEALFGAHWPGRPGLLSDTVRDKAKYGSPHDVEWASGAAMLISSECNIAVGSWDESRFFLYSEETDFAARARHCGFRIRYVPTARAHHEIGGSGRSTELETLMAVNKIRYYQKYHGRTASAMFRAIATLHYSLRSAHPEARNTLKVILRRSSWAKLPHGDAVEASPAVKL